MTRSAKPDSTSPTERTSVDLPFGHRIPQLDALRGIACLMVLLAHLKALPGLALIPEVLGVAGVGIFFALSGFLITRGLVHGDRQLTAFYNRRAARILPPYLLLVAVLAVVWPGRPLLWVAAFCFNWLYRSGSREYFHVDAGEAPIPPVGHTWSLCVEEHFYWMWPPLVVWLSPRVASRIALLVIFGTPLFAFWMIFALHHRDFRWLEIDGLLQRLTLTQMTAIAIGCWIAVHEQSMAERVAVGGRAVRRIALLSLPCVIVPLAAYATSSDTTSPLEMALGPTFLHVFCGGVFGLAMCWTSLGRVTWLRWVGQISYGLYLYHLPIYASLGLAESGAEPDWGQGLVAVALTFAAAAASFYWMERPIIQWAKRRNQAATAAERTPGRLGVVLAIGLAILCGVTVGVSDRRTRRTVDALLGITPIIPIELRREVIAPPGTAESAYRWMGVVHAVDQNGFRRDQPIPRKRLNIARIAVFGDSYTWGACVDADKTYAAELEKILQEQRSAVEVLNCGKAGGQSEDLLGVLQEQVLPLEPDMVVYGITTSDILPSEAVGVGNIARAWKRDADVQRFQSLLTQMQKACDQANALLVGVVLSQMPDDPDQRQLTLRIQRLCREAGVTMASVDGYLEANRTRNYEFSVWDRHPNASCHRLYAELLANHLLASPDARLRLRLAPMQRPGP